MKDVWKWIVGLLAALVLLSIVAVPFMMALLGWGGGYGMMSVPGGGWHMPMHYGGWTPMMGGWGWMGVGMLLSGLIQLGLLVLVVLGIVWLLRAIARQDQKGS